MSKSRTHRKPAELSGLVLSGLRTLETEAGGITALVAAMQDAWMEGRLSEAMAIQNRLVPLHDALFSETSPAPVKSSSG